MKWTEFQSGPPYFEAIASNRLDFGEVGNSPVISAQAAGIEFTEIANTSYARKGTGILVQKDSKITSVKDLKGKKIAVAKEVAHLIYCIERLIKKVSMRKM